MEKPTNPQRGEVGSQQTGRGFARYSAANNRPDYRAFMAPKTALSSFSFSALS